MHFFMKLITISEQLHQIDLFLMEFTTGKLLLMPEQNMNLKLEFLLKKLLMSINLFLIMNLDLPSMD